MSKTAEQVTSEAIESHWKTALNTHGPICVSGTAFGVVSAMRSAGWIRESPNREAYESFERAIRERDEALKECAAWKETARVNDVNAGFWRNQYHSSPAASPEVMRVVRDAEWLCEGYDAVRWNALKVSVDALSASRQPKAQEPRYEVVASSGGWQEGGCVRSIKTQELVFGSWRGICDSDSLASFHKERCIAECARLNGEGGGK